ncbi:MAG: DUF4193 family protein [Actinomycetota bacterium]
MLRDEEADELEALDDEDDQDLDLEDLEDDLEDLDEDEDDDEGADEDEEADDEDDVGGQESLEELLDQKPSPKRGAARPDSDEDTDIMALTSERDDRVGARLPSRVTPIKDKEEFVCRGCYLVKSKWQLADKERGLCRDCV